VYTGVPETNAVPAHMKACTRPLKHKCLTRFRLCSWSFLEVHAEQSMPRSARRPRHMRVCRHCEAGTPEDEKHVLFECTLYNRIRERYRYVFTPAIMASKDTKRIMNHPNIHALVDAIFAMHQLRKGLL
jgi:hypothetical protein